MNGKQIYLLDIAKLREAILKRPRVEEVNMKPMWPSHKNLSPYTTCVINVKCWSVIHQQFFWSGIPFSKYLITEGNLKILEDLVMQHVHIVDNIGPTYGLSWTDKGYKK